MTGKERVLYFVWVVKLFTERQPEKYKIGTLMQSLEDGGIVWALFFEGFLISFMFYAQTKQRQQTLGD